MPRNSTRPPAWATDGNYAAPGESWNATARRVATALAAFAAAGLVPELPTPAQSMNEWLAQVAEFVRDPYPDLFGRGSDGAVVVAGTTTLTRDMHADTIVVQNGGIIHTNGFRVFARTSITTDVGGVIACDGLPGASGAAGGAGGAARAAGTLAATVAGGAGGAAGGSNNGAQGNDQAAGLGGDGGAGGDSTGAGTGGVQGDVTSPTAAQGDPTGTEVLGHVIEAIRGRLLDGTLWAGGASGGGGAGEVLQAGGGGGSPGGAMLLVAPLITNNGTIRALGGNGGVHVGAGGGGGSGGGGVIVRIIRDALAGTGTWSVAGGTPGTSTVGDPGIAGTVGRLVTYEM